MVTSFSPSLGCNVLNQFPSIVMFGMKGFYIASGAIQGHHGPLVFLFSCNDLNSLPNDKTVDSSKLEAFADDKINVTQNLKFVFEKIDNIVGKRENAGYHSVFYLRKDKFNFLGNNCNSIQFGQG